MDNLNGISEKAGALKRVDRKPRFIGVFIAAVMGLI
jgi:hypothetical protein